MTLPFAPLHCTKSLYLLIFLYILQMLIIRYLPIYILTYILYHIFFFFFTGGVNRTFPSENGVAFIPGSWWILHKPPMGSDCRHAHAHSLYVYCWAAKSPSSLKTSYKIVPWMHTWGKSLKSIFIRINLYYYILESCNIY